MHQNHRYLWMCLAVGSLLACGHAKPRQAAPKAVKNKSSKPLTEAQKAVIFFQHAQLIEPGVLYNELPLRGGEDGLQRLWIYRPQKPASAKLPCVFVAPAGTPLVHGARLGDGSRPEHMPYVRAGMIVIAYDIDGAVPENAVGMSLINGESEFFAAKAGLISAQNAINTAIKYVPGVDPKRLFVAGHSSAGTLALQVAQNDPRIAACAAYAPACNFEIPYQGRSIVDYARDSEPVLRGFTDFIRSMSPQANTERLRCPLFLFHATDDTRVLGAEVATFAATVKRTNKNVTFARVPSGGHYQSMIDQGIPKAIDWFRTIK